MLRIRDYRILFPEGEFSLELPRAATVLSVAFKGEKFWMSVLENPELDKDKRKFKLAGAGHEFDYHRNTKIDHIGSAQQTVGGMIWHFFEINKPLEMRQE